MDEDEAELNEAKEKKPFFEFFKDLADVKVSLTDEDEGYIASTYLFVHDENIGEG